MRSCALHVRFCFLHTEQRRNVLFDCVNLLSVLLFCRAIVRCALGKSDRGVVFGPRQCFVVLLICNSVWALIEQLLIDLIDITLRTAIAFNTGPTVHIYILE